MTTEQGTRPGPAVLRVHHVQITIPRGAEAHGQTFYCDVLGMAEVPKPPSLAGRGGFWLSPGGGDDAAALLVHVGTEDGADRTATKAHVAYEVTDLAGWKERLMRHGVRVLDAEPIPGFDRFEFRDPFGNRVELIQPLR